MSPGFGEALVLGVVQGITEFLPISSSGHLALGQILFGMKDAPLTLSVMLHAGTLLATVLVLRRRVASATVEGLRAVIRPSLFRSTPGGRDALVVIICTIPTGAAGFLLRDVVARWTSSPTVIGLGFVLTALFLLSTRWIEPGKDEVPTWLGALVLGFAQATSILPGVSRSGLTITAALWLGVRPDRAFELSMLMSLPAVLGATLLEVPEAWRGGGGGLLVAGVGAVAACAVGIAALLLLRGVVDRGRLSFFALWVVPLAMATLAFAKAWPGS